MKRIILMLFVLLQIFTRSVANSDAQKTYTITDGVMLNGYMVTGLGRDSTMLAATNQNMVTALAVKQYIDSTGRPMNVNIAALLADTAANHLNLIKFYNRGGLVSHQMKIWADTVTPSTANGYSVNISSAGFTTILSIQATVFQNSSTAATIPLISGKTFTNSAAVINIQTSNTGVIGLLVGLIFATNLAGMTVHLVVVGY